MTRGDGIPVDADALRRWREKRVLTRMELAQKAGVGKSCYYAVESGSQRTCRPETSAS